VIKNLPVTLLSAAFLTILLFSFSHSNAQFVGINTSTPGTALDVNGAVRLNEKLILTPPSTVSAGSTITLNAIYSSYIVADDASNQSNTISFTGTLAEGQILYVLNNDAQSLSLGSETISPGATGYFIYLDSGWRNIIDGLNADSGITYLDSISANHYAGSSISLTNVMDASSTSVTVSPDVFVTNLTVSGTFTNLSDFRYKGEIKPLDGALDKVLKLNGVKYNWKIQDFPEKHFNNKIQIGFIAQEVEDVYPDLVHTDSDGYKSVEYHKVAPILVEAVKEQQALIATQAQALKQLSAEKASLELRLEKLEAIVKTLK